MRQSQPPVPTPGSPDMAAMLDHARKVCASANERFTPIREAIYGMIAAEPGAVKAYDLLERLRPEQGSPKPPTVYRALEFLSRLGLVHKVEALNAYVACAPCGDPDHAPGHAHGHVARFFVCETCNRVEERHADGNIDSAPEGFTVRRSVIEHYGTCVSCTA